MLLTPAFADRYLHRFKKLIEDLKPAYLVRIDQHDPGAAKRAACRAVVVTAISERSRSWWESLGFRPLHPGDPDGLDLYLLTSDIEATLAKLS